MPRLPTDADAVVAELPFPEPGRVAVNAVAVHASTRHWRPLLNGYSGYTPKSYVEHYLAFQQLPRSRRPSTRCVAPASRTSSCDVARCPMPSRRCSDVDGVRLLAADTRLRIYRIR